MIPDFRAENKITFQQDFDGDGKEEILIGFPAVTDDEAAIPASFIVLGDRAGDYFKYRFAIEVTKEGYERLRRCEHLRSLELFDTKLYGWP